MRGDLRLVLSAAGRGLPDGTMRPVAGIASSSRSMTSTQSRPGSAHGAAVRNELVTGVGGNQIPVALLEPTLVDARLSR